MYDAGQFRCVTPKKLIKTAIYHTRNSNQSPTGACRWLSDLDLENLGVGNYLHERLQCKQTARGDWATAVEKDWGGGGPVMELGAALQETIFLL